jgi:hypothetical protein
MAWKTPRRSSKSRSRAKSTATPAPRSAERTWPGRRPGPNPCCAPLYSAPAPGVASRNGILPVRAARRSRAGDAMAKPAQPGEHPSRSARMGRAGCWSMPRPDLRATDRRHPGPASAPRSAAQFARFAAVALTGAEVDTIAGPVEPARSAIAFRLLWRAAEPGRAGGSEPDLPRAQPRIRHARGDAD